MSLQALEERYKELSRKVYSDEVKKGIEGLLKDIPPADDAKISIAEKVSILRLRGKTRLLLPSFSKEAETDLNKALKLHGEDPATWVAMSEAYWKRNSVQEAREALDTALKCHPNYQPALCQLSRVLRSSCSLPDQSPEQKLALLGESVSAAKDAVKVDPNCGEAWAALGVALVQEAIGTGMDLPSMKKALAALHQAASKDPTNPDIFYNRAVVQRCFGHYGAAFKDFVHAWSMDPQGLRGSRALGISILEMLQRAKRLATVPFAGYGNEKEFKKSLVNKLPARGTAKVAGGGRSVEVRPLQEVLDVERQKKSEKETVWLAAKVIDILTQPSEQPQVYACADKNGSVFIFLLYRTLQSAVKLQDVILVPFPPSSAAVLSHDVPKWESLIEGGGGDSQLLKGGEVPEGTGEIYPIATVVVEPNTILVNDAPIPAKYHQSPQLATRYFQ